MPDPAISTPYGYRTALAAAFGVRLVSDIPERLCRLGVRPWVDGERRARIDAIRRAGVLFVHVPKNAGMSISQHLYGCQVKHRSIRYYQSVAPDLATLPSVAVVRDPVRRFLSAFAYARAGGTAHNRVATPFNARYRGFAGIDDALDHLAGARGPFDVDHIFRPQSWYLRDADGRLAVDELIAFEDLARLTRIGRHRLAAPLPRINAGAGLDQPLTAGQIERIRGFYHADFALVAGLQRRLAKGRQARMEIATG
ncbi:hypothetical protein [Sphingomonas sanxanigenens]|uniref:Sulfotransferase family protein n=1 Tax=Sphingomonas sanxanigenens DSM 19645 = NX02 TaxID=1123269 RepID=W0ADZ1_9SPHN|nr:hypothetical protein [Sphingomonas sanxanigenens]AHE56104.1 hypothetical protein NX02_22420 [Sphingomonas sanxanigenens DSM 19645 = NX02]